MNSAQLQILSDELVNDPLTRGYAGMTDAQAAADLNTVYRTRNRSSLTGDEVFQATEPAEYGGLTDAQKSQWLAFCGRDIIDPFANANEQFVVNLFGGGSNTVTSLQSLRVESVSRGVELGLGLVRPGDVEKARAL